jgi:hypothetical protein
VPRPAGIALFARWAGAIGVLGFAGLAALAQPVPFACAPLLASTARQPAYGPSAVPGRCEGFYEKNVSQPFVELVSLTRATPGSWQADAEGRLPFSASTRLDARLLIQPMRSNPLYRVDAWLGKGSTLRWDSSTMLQATGLRLRDLGLLASVVGAAADLPALLPVATDPAGDQSAAIAHAVLRPSVAVSRLSWRGYRTGPAAATLSDWADLPGAPLFAWERIALPIRLPADGHGLRIDVRAIDARGEALPLLQFAIVGVADDKP